MINMLFQDWPTKVNEKENNPFLIMIKREFGKGKMMQLLKEDDKIRRFYTRQWFEFMLHKFTDREYDSLILIPRLQVVVNIEVKNVRSTIPKTRSNNIQKARDQLEEHRSFFQCFFGPTLPNWSFVSVMCIPNLNVREDFSEACDYCKKYIIDKR